MARASAELVVSLSGLPEIYQNLQRLRLATQHTVMSKAVRAAAKIIQAEAAQRAPHLSGKLESHMIISQSGEMNSFEEVRMKVGPAMDAWYGLFQEIGTAHHAPQPFLAPALEAVRDDAITAMQTILEKAVNKAVRRL